MSCDLHLSLYPEDGRCGSKQHGERGQQQVSSPASFESHKKYQGGSIDCFSTYSYWEQSSLDLFLLSVDRLGLLRLLSCVMRNKKYKKLFKSVLKDIT